VLEPCARAPSSGARAAGRPVGLGTVLLLWRLWRRLRRCRRLLLRCCLLLMLVLLLLVLREGATRHSHSL